MESNWAKNIGRDLAASVVVFLVALPLCLGIALASRAPGMEEGLNVPLFSGLLAGIVGGIVVGSLSGSHTSVSGPAAGLTAVVAMQIEALGSYQAFVAAVAVAGFIQILLGVLRAGFISAFFPSSVIKGLLAAIGVILILKQIPHVLGRDSDPEGDMSFSQPDHHNTFTELWAVVTDVTSGHVVLGAAIIGVASLVFLVLSDRFAFFKKVPVLAPVTVVAFGFIMRWLFNTSGGPLLAVQGEHLVNVPVAQGLQNFDQFIVWPDWSHYLNPQFYIAAVTVAIVASLETLLNLEAVDKLDPKQRNSPPDRELFAQGCGNVVSGMFGGLPITSVIVRSSVNVRSGAVTKLSAIAHGFILVGFCFFGPQVLNSIPLSCLAAILLHTGFKLANPELFKQMWREGWNQFLPFIITVTAIVLTDLLIGIIIGLVFAIGFILKSNLRRPLHLIRENHVSGEVLRIELANQVSFLNRAALLRVLENVPAGSRVLLDARSTDYIDPDVLDLISDFKKETAPAKNISVSRIGFKDRYVDGDEIEFIDFSTRELQENMRPEHVLQVLKDGNERFRTGHSLTRNYTKAIHETAEGQFPLACVVSCIDSRNPTEIIFDLGVGDVFTVRIAGNVVKEKVMASIEYACAVAGAKLVVILGHTRCGAVTAAVNLAEQNADPAEATGCEHLAAVVNEIQKSIEPARQLNETRQALKQTRWAPKSSSVEPEDDFPDIVARANVDRMMHVLLEQSHTMAKLCDEGKIGVVGGMYDVRTGGVEFFESAPSSLLEQSPPEVQPPEREQTVVQSNGQ
ncbi:bifunctional SulP family inorganic anion transporter/carbonic anhydrase [Stratiformator vulcanicus]|uniref:C4-dicarboxylic acid transporter DauA n=1 Tax=Stratiformator vulcanicus TaxID=2527980 RepID=A0A517R0A7_9PLAN|nr:SulP family inorganic anion transporter [Stratiformator vulcanicus]QDT37250.1 C4-dicarboxylic acid transporter DauA [Stratiformator vulcanicus]